MNRRQKSNCGRITILTISILFINIVITFGQAQNITNDSIYKVQGAAQETLRTIHVSKEQGNINNVANIFVGTNTGKILSAPIDLNDERAKPFFKQIDIKEGLIRDFYFVTAKMGYVLKNDGIYKFEFEGQRFILRPFVKVEDLKQEGNSIPRLYTMAFVKNTSRVCIGGAYIAENTDNQIDKQLLLCTDNITENKPEWDKPDMPDDAQIQITSINFSDNKNGWAVGTEGTIWITGDKGENWKKEEAIFQNVKIEDAFMSVFGLQADKAWAVGYNSQVWSRSGGANNIRVTNVGQIVEEICKNDIVRIKEEALEEAQIYVGVNVEGVVTEVIKNTRKLKVSLKTILPEKIKKAIENSLLGDLGYEDVEVIQSTCPRTNRNNTGGGSGQGNQKNNEAGAWIKKTILPKETILRGVKFSPFDTDKGWIIGDGGTILYTQNGGAVWQPVQITSLTPANKTLLKNTNFYSIFVDEDSCWIVGTGGLIIHIKYRTKQN